MRTPQRRRDHRRRQEGAAPGRPDDDATTSGGVALLAPPSADDVPVALPDVPEPTARLVTGVQGGRRAERRLALKRARRRRRLRTLGILVAAAAVAVPLGLAGEALWSSRGGDDAATTDDATTDPALADGVDPQPSVLFATFDEQRPGDGATGLAVLAHDRVDQTSTLLLVPSTTVADIPGRGLLQLGLAYRMGDAPLLDASVDNLLGIDVDHVVAVSRQGWSSLFTRMDGLEVDVPERLRGEDADGDVVLRFNAGLQRLDGPQLGELLTLRQPDEAELAVLPRSQRVFEATLDRIAADPGVLDTLFDDGAPMLDTAADLDQVRELFELAAADRSEGRFTSLSLPVQPRGSGADASYEVDDERAELLVERRFEASRPTGATSGVQRLQVLNGNGTPGVGQAVAERLIPQGYRVVLTGNADRFTHETTQVVVYRDEPEVLAAAEGIVETLGFGEVVLSDTPQSVVDVTIVVGRDIP